MKIFMEHWLDRWIQFLTFIGPRIANIFAEYNQQEGDRGSTVVKVLCYSGTAVAQWLKCCATVGPR